MNGINRPNQINMVNQIKEIDVVAYWNLLKAHKKIIISVFLLVVIAVMIKTLTETPIYRATTRIMIEQANPNMINSQEFYVTDYSYTDFYQTQCKILESRALASDVNQRLKDQGHADSENIGMSGLTVTPVKNTKLIDISVDSANPEMAAKLANTLVESYINWNLNLRIKGQQDASRFLDEQVKAAKARQEASEVALQQYREKYGVAVIEAPSTKNNAGGQDLTRQNLSTVNQQLLEATNRRMELEIQYTQALELMKNDAKAETIPAAVDNVIIVGIKQQEIALQREKMEKGQKYGGKHPSMLALDQEIAKLKLQKMQEIRNIVDSMKSRYDNAQKQENSLRRAVGVSQSQTISRDKIAIQYQVLQQEVESNRALYDMLLKRMKETSVNEENRIVNIHVVDSAQVPQQYYKPDIKKSLLLAILAGLGLGIGIAFLMDYLDKTVKNPEELERLLHIPYLGAVPHFETDVDISEKELISFNDPLSSASESYRGVRTGILFSTAGHKPRTILVTSANVGEGKTITSANIAAVMAQTGAKVLLIDADMRRPQQHRIFGKKNERGLTNVLVGDEDWKSVIESTPIQNLSYIPSGPIPPNPAELVGSASMKQAIDQFLQHYDHIIIDSPPINVVTDPLVLSKMVDGVIIVLVPDKVTKDQIKRAYQQLQNVKANVLGVVFNNINLRKDSYYNSYHYYHYKYYYAEDGEKSKRQTTKQTKT